MYIVVKELRDPTTKIALGNNIFTNLVVSTASTIGLYFLHVLPVPGPVAHAHVVAAVLRAAAQLHHAAGVRVLQRARRDSEGTKGDNVSRTDLGTAQGKDGVVELEMPSEQLDIDSCYDSALRNLRDRVEVAGIAPVSEAQAQEDYYRAVRTYMVIVWLVSNAVLAMAVSEAYGATHVADNFLPQVHPLERGRRGAVPRRGQRHVRGHERLPHHRRGAREVEHEVVGAGQRRRIEGQPRRVVVVGQAVVVGQRDRWLVQGRRREGQGAGLVTDIDLAFVGAGMYDSSMIPLL